MYTFIIEFIAFVLWVGGFWHAMRHRNRSFAQQWFFSSYLATLVRETINLFVFQIYFFAPSIVRLGNAPVLLAMLAPSVFYLAYAFARRWVDPPKSAMMLGLIFLITASFALPIEATAAQLRWWLYSDARLPVFGGVPLTAPLVWGGNAAIFYAAFWRIRQSRLNEPGKLYALIALAPLIAVGQILLAVLLNL